MVNPDLGGINPFRDKSAEFAILSYFLAYPDRIFKPDMQTYPDRKVASKIKRAKWQDAFNALIDRGMLIVAELPQETKERIAKEREAKQDG